MVINESDIRKRIEDLEDKLKQNEELFPKIDDLFLEKKLLMQSFNIESQLYAFYYVLGEEYKYKYM